MIPGPASLTRWPAFLALCAAMFVAILDIQVVASSLVIISDDLMMADGQLVWIQTAYLTAEVLGIALSGRLLSGIGLGRSYALCLGGFMAASLLCGLSPTPEWLITARILQGLFGGVLIPLVFSAVFLLFERHEQSKATAVAGSFAMLAPTLGPLVGGYITDTLSWHWVFFINLPIGLLILPAAFSRALQTSCDRTRLSRLSLGALALTIVALVVLELGLKEFDALDWSTPAAWLVPLVMILCVGIALLRLHRCDEPLLDLSLFQDRAFAVACGLSFLLGMALFSSVYLLPVFLGLVREFSALQIGLVMIVMGGAQLLAAAPSALSVERFDARWLTALGFTLFASGCLANGFQTPESGFDEQFWPQVLRGAAVLLCILPPTAMAMAALPPPRVSDGSCMFNLLRNLGGAVGLAAVDVILTLRGTSIGRAYEEKLLAGDRQTAEALGLPRLEMFTGQPIDLDTVDPFLKAIGTRIVEKAAVTQAMNEAWMLLALLCMASLPLLLLIPRTAARPAELTPGQPMPACPSDPHDPSDAHPSPSVKEPVHDP